MSADPAAMHNPDHIEISVDPALSKLLRVAHRRYFGWRFWYHQYAWSKYLLDPCYRAVASQIRPDTDTIDLGTGLGMLPVLLGLWGGERRCLGTEWDEQKVRYGQRAARELAGIQIQSGDVRDCDIPTCDAITLIDVLHYHPPEAQRDILRRAAVALRPGGRILIREGDLDTRGSSRWTRWVEQLSMRIGWNKGSSTHFRSLVDMRADLSGLGLSVRDVYLAGPLHPGNVLIVAEKPS